jgi:hypothetical protein
MKVERRRRASVDEGVGGVTICILVVHELAGDADADLSRCRNR